MTGPEHYREAENLLAMAEEQVMAAAAGDPTCGDPREPERNIAAAQVHATLALAAATALNPSKYNASAAAESWRQTAGDDHRDGAL